MGKLGDELKKKYKTPREALRALGLDEKLLDVSHLAYDGANPMKSTRIGAMTLMATAAAISPMLAMDQKVTLSSALFNGLTSKNFKESKPALVKGIQTALDGKLRKGLAMDATMKGVAKVFDAFEKMNAEEMDKPDEAEAKDEEVDPMPMDEEEDKPKAFDAEPMKAFLKEKGMSEDDIGKCMDMMPKNALDEESEEEKKKKEKEAAAKAAKDAEMDKDKVSKPAMDAALQAQAKELTANFEKQVKAVRDSERAVRVAIAEVHPWTGDIPATMAFDSAADVHRHALIMKGVEGAKTLHADALLPILKTLPKNGARAAERFDGVTIAMDESAVTKAIKMAPGLENISTVL